MTAPQLANIYCLTRQTILDDIHAGLYPRTSKIYRSDGSFAYHIQDFIQHYPRAVWQKIHTSKPSELTTTIEQEAYIVTYGDKIPTRTLAMQLLIPTEKVRYLYNRAFDAGRVSPIIDQRRRKPNVSP